MAVAAFPAAVAAAMQAVDTEEGTAKTVFPKQRLVSSHRPGLIQRGPGRFLAADII